MKYGIDISLLKQQQLYTMYIYGITQARERGYIGIKMLKFAYNPSILYICYTYSNYYYLESSANCVESAIN